MKKLTIEQAQTRAKFPWETFVHSDVRTLLTKYATQVTSAQMGSVNILGCAREPAHCYHETGRNAREPGLYRGDVLRAHQCHKTGEHECERGDPKNASVRRTSAGNSSPYGQL